MKKTLATLSLLVFMTTLSIQGVTQASVQNLAAQDTVSPRTPRVKNTSPVPHLTSEASPLSLGDYLTQVADKHEGFKAADQSSKAARLYAKESSLLFTPSLTGTGSYASDGISNPFDSPNRLHYASYVAGLNEQTDFGLTSKLSFNDIEMAAPDLGPQYSGSYTSHWFQLDLSQSLWRNWNGREMRAQSTLINEGSLAKAFQQTYMSKQLMIEAESNYWRLALTREVVKVQVAAVERAQKINDWTSHRVKMNLVDRAESLQSSTNLQAQLLNLRTATDNEATAAQAFNSSRGVDSNIVTESLVELAPELVSQMNAPARTATRDDVKAAELQAKANSANAMLSAEKDKPTVELFATLPLTKPTGDPSSPVAIFLPLNSRPATTIGVRLNAPLDIGTLDRAKQGWAAEANAATLTYQRKVFEEQRDWDDLKNKFSQAQERLKLYVDLEKMQREKLYYERDRQKRGRSTLEQVLLYEADYESAESGRINTLAELLNLNAQMKLYGVSYESR